MSVTYGAGGATRALTVDVTKWIKEELGIEAMAHLSCVGHTLDELHEILDEMRDAGIDNVLALRGDPPKGETEFKPVPDGLVVRLGPDRADLGVLRLLHRRRLLPGGAPGGAGPRARPAHLKRKVDAGATFLITQLFFDNEDYFEFVDRARASGIDVPIIAGIMPITNFEQIKRFTSMCGATIPPALLRAARGARTRRARRPSRSWASPTRPCSAPTCSRAARPGSTSTR